MVFHEPIIARVTDEGVIFYEANIVFADLEHRSLIYEPGMDLFEAKESGLEQAVAAFRESRGLPETQQGFQIRKQEPDERSYLISPNPLWKSFSWERYYLVYPTDDRYLKYQAIEFKDFNEKGGLAFKAIEAIAKFRRDPSIFKEPDFWIAFAFSALVSGVTTYYGTKFLKLDDNRGYLFAKPIYYGALAAASALSFIYSNLVSKDAEIKSNGFLSKNTVMGVSLGLAIGSLAGNILARVTPDILFGTIYPALNY